MPGSPPVERLHRRRRTGELTPVPSAWSDVELLRHKDFARIRTPRWRSRGC